MLRIYFFFGLILFSWASFSAVTVTWGNGSLRLKHIPKLVDQEVMRDLRVMETELLIDQRLSSSILSSSEKKVVIEFDGKNQNLSDLKEIVVGKILKAQGTSKVRKNKDPSAPPSMAPPKSSYDPSTSGQFVVVDQVDFRVVSGGEKVVIEEGESLNSLVVLGGEVQINGEVKNLYLLKGIVNVGRTGQISEKITELAGSINSSEGSFITAERSSFMDKFNISGNLVKGILSFQGWRLSWSLIVFRFIQTLFVFWLGLKIIPYICEAELKKKQNWGQSFFMGLVHFFLAPFVVFLLLISVIGLGVIPLYLGLLYVMGLLGYGLISYIVGDRFLRQIKPHGARPWSLCFLVGFVLFELLMAAPYFGYIVLFLLLLFSLGLVSQAFVKRKSVPLT